MGSENLICLLWLLLPDRSQPRIETWWSVLLLLFESNRKSKLRKLDWNGGISITNRTLNEHEERKITRRKNNLIESIKKLSKTTQNRKISTLITQIHINIYLYLNIYKTAIFVSNIIRILLFLDWVIWLFSFIYILALLKFCICVMYKVLIPKVVMLTQT